MANGIVKWFSSKKGYGFIEQENGEDIFVHFSQLKMEGFKTLDKGDRVTFEVEKGEQGPSAKDVKTIQSDSGYLAAFFQDLEKKAVIFNF